MDNYSKSIKLKVELSNQLYDVVEEAILYMAEENKYSETNMTKLLLAIYKDEYDYITNYNGYRDQIKLLNEYFEKEYHHALISFIMIKRLKQTDCSKLILEEIKDTNIGEQVLYFLETENYIELLDLMESEKRIFIAIAKVYVKTIKRND